MSSKINENNKPTIIITAMLVFAWSMLYFDGIWTYVQKTFVGKKYIPTSVFLLILFSIFMSRVSIKNYVGKSKVAMSMGFVWFCWMLLVLLIASQDVFSNPFRVAFGFYTNNWPILLLIIALGSALRARFDVLKKMLIIFALPVLLLGVAQGIAQDNFEIGRKIAEEAQSFNLGFYGQRRANSVFGHAEDLGYFGAACSAVSLAFLISARSWSQRFSSIAILVLSLAATYFTLTRATYVTTAFALLACFVVIKAENSRHAKVILRVLPIIFLFGGALIFFSAPLINMFQSGILSTASLADRFYGNQYYLAELGRTGWSGYMTGLGWYVNGHHRAVFPIDNQYLGLVLNTGFAGLLIWMVICYSIWLWMIELHYANPNSISAGLIAVCSTWFAIAFFNVSNSFAMFALVSVIALKSVVQKVELCETRR